MLIVTTKEANVLIYTSKKLFKQPSELNSQCQVKVILKVTLKVTWYSDKLYYVALNHYVTVESTL